MQPNLFGKYLLRKIIPTLLSTLVIGLMGAHSLADVVHLKRGGTIEGETIERESTVDVLVPEGTTTFNKTDIERIEKSPENHKDSLHGLLDQAKSFSAGIWTKAKRQFESARHAIRRRTKDWSKPVGHKKDNPHSIKAISAKERERIS